VLWTREIRPAPFKVRCGLIAFIGDEEEYPCHFGYKIGYGIFYSIGSSPEKEPEKALRIGKKYLQILHRQQKT
jgi:hypothetical protein